MSGKIGFGATYRMECVDKWGNPKWEEQFPNRANNDGLDLLLEQLLVSATASPLWYVGLKGSGSGSAADTISSHPAWQEIINIQGTTRPQFNPGSVASQSVDNSASKAVYTASGSAAIAGAFLVDDNTLSGSTGVLLSTGDFSAVRSLADGDVLNVTVTVTSGQKV